MKILSYNGGLNGSYLNRPQGTFMTPTAMSFKKAEKGYAGLFNGTTSLVDAGNYDDLIGNITAYAWIYVKGWGEDGTGRIFDNGKFKFGVIQTNARLFVTSDTTLRYSANNSIVFNRWYFVCVTRTAAGIVNIYINGALSGGADQDSDTPVAGNTNIFIGNKDAESSTWDGLIGIAEIDDTILSAEDRAREYERFVHAKSISIEKFPVYNPHTKPTDLSQLVDTGLVAAWNFIPNNRVLVDVSGEGNNGALVDKPRQSLDGLIFDGADDYISTTFNPRTALTSGGSFTINMRVLTTSTAGLGILIGEATGGTDRWFVGYTAGGNYYTGLGNNLDDTGQPITLNNWINISFVYDGTSMKIYENGILVDENTFVFGGTYPVSAGIARGSGLVWYHTGQIGDIKVYSVAKDLQAILDYHNSFASRVVLVEHFRCAAVGQSKAREWIPGTGTYVINELNAQDAVLKELDVGVKYLQCSAPGLIHIPSRQSYGTWEYAVYKGADANNTDVNFINSNKETYPDAIGAYNFRIDSVEGVFLQRRNGAAISNLFSTGATYITINTWYKIKITRTLDGEFYTYIKGGAFGANYVLVDVTGGAGTNPVTDNTYTTSEYFVLDFDAGDRIALINIQQGVSQ